jgi:hypothetical protein
MSFKYINDTYQVPAGVRRRVTVDGRSGVIVDVDGQYIVVNFDDKKPNHRSNCHPTWRVVYGELGDIRKLTASQVRYQHYLKSECNESFGDYLANGWYKGATA